ncbi:MAG: AMIN domain-containing protein, partial [Cyanobacteria bacterium P01_D01_bin.128]
MKRKTVAAHLAISVGVSAQMMVLLGRGAIVPAIMATAIARPVEAATIVDWAFDPATRQLQVVLPSGVTPRYFLLAEPTRIVMDLPNTQVGNIPTHRTYSGQVRSVSVAQFNHRSTRIVMELAPNTVLDPQQAKLDRVAGDGQTRWVLQPLLADIAPSTVAGGVAIAAQTAEPGLDITAPGMRFSEDDPGTPLTERSPASTASATALLRPQSPAADISALPETSGDRPASSNRPTVSVPPLAEAARSAPAAAPTVTVPPLNQGLSDADGSAEVATDSNSVTDTADATSVSASPAGDPGLAITPEEASSSVAIAVEPTGPDVAEAAEASPTLPPFLSGTNLDSLESSPDLPSNSSGGNLDLPAPQAPEVEAPGVEAPEVEVPEVETPDLTALAPEDSELPSNADVEPAEVTQPEMPALAASAAVGSEPAAIAAQPPAAIAAQPIESERDSTAEIEPLPAPSAQSTEPTPSSNQSSETPSSAPPSAETVETSPPHQPSPAETINLPNSASSPTPEAEAAPPLLDSTDPAQAAPTPPPTTAAPAPTTAAPATSAPGSNNVPAITFGEPLPATERDGNLSQSSPQPASN